MVMQVYDTDTLLGVVNELDFFDPFLLSMFFPEVITFDTSKIDFDVISEDDSLAPFVSPMVAGKADKASGGELRSFKPAYVKPKSIVDPERVLKRRPGEQIGGALNPAGRRNAIIADILSEQRKRILRRFEWMAAQALLTGKVTVSGEDYPEAEVDFKRDAGNSIVLAGLNVWSDLANATPLDDIESWNDLAEAPVTDLVMDSSAYKKFIKFQEVKDLMESRRGSESNIELGPENGKWVTYKGMVGSYRVWIYKGYYTVNGVKTPYIPADTVIACSSALEGVRAYGAILDGEAGYQAMEMFPKNWANKDPAVEYIMTQSAPLMIPKRVNASVAIKVA